MDPISLITKTKISSPCSDVPLHGKYTQNIDNRSRYKYRGQCSIFNCPARSSIMDNYVEHPSPYQSDTPDIGRYLETSIKVEQATSSVNEADNIYQELTHHDQARNGFVTPQMSHDNVFSDLYNTPTSSNSWNYYTEESQESREGVQHQVPNHRPFEPLLQTPLDHSHYYLDPAFQTKYFQPVGSNKMELKDAPNILKYSNNIYMITNGAVKGMTISTIQFQKLDVAETLDLGTEKLFLKLSVARELVTGAIIPVVKVCNAHARSSVDRSILKARNNKRSFIYDDSPLSIVPGIIYNLQQEDFNHPNICVTDIDLLITCYNSCKTSESLISGEGLIRVETNKLLLIATLESQIQRKVFRRVITPIMSKTRITPSDRNRIFPIRYENQPELRNNPCKHLATILLLQCNKLQIEPYQVFNEVRKMQAGQTTTQVSRMYHA